MLLETLGISIHALREEGDLFAQICKDRIIISIHALREEGDWILRPSFQARQISIHALREEGDMRTMHRVQTAQTISIHALREEGDLSRLSVEALEELFLSTPSARRATAMADAELALVRISIHALREEGDAGHSGNQRRLPDFYPRPPRGGRR